MDSFNTKCNTVAEKTFSDPQAYVAENTRVLNREAWRMHMRHSVSWLLRSALVILLFYLGDAVIESEIGGAVKWTAALMSAYLLMYAIKGHRKVQNLRQARLYWLHDEAAHAQPVAKEAREKPQLIIASSLKQEEIQGDAGWVRKQALS